MNIKQSRSIIFNSDEFFILVGLASMNMKDPNILLDPLREYNRSSNKYRITLSKTVVAELIQICDEHNNKKGGTLKVINKLKMINDLLNIDSTYEKEIGDTYDRYKDGIFKG